jgi:hypothetical protein
MVSGATAIRFSGGPRRGGRLCQKRTGGASGDHSFVLDEAALLERGALDGACGTFGASLKDTAVSQPPRGRQGGLARAELRPRRSRYCGDGQCVANHVNEVAASPCEMIDIDRTNARQGAREEGRIAHATALGFRPIIDDNSNLYSKHYDCHVIYQGSRGSERDNCMGGGRR